MKIDVMKGAFLNRTVFLSSTNLGLRNTRAAIADLLRIQGVEPVEERISLQPESIKLRRQIEGALNRATGVLCLVGPYFGCPMEPLNPDHSPRLSYTQWECLLALRKQAGQFKIFLLEDDYFKNCGKAEFVSEVDPAIPDSRFFREWQDNFRSHVRECHPRCSIHSEAELWKKLAMINWRDWPQ